MAATGGKPVQIQQETKGNLLSVSIKSPEPPVIWQIKFSAVNPGR